MKSAITIQSSVDDFFNACCIRHIDFDKDRVATIVSRSLFSLLGNFVSSFDIDVGNYDARAFLCKTNSRSTSISDVLACQGRTPLPPLQQWPCRGCGLRRR
jgi:hypothetical protein